MTPESRLMGSVLGSRGCPPLLPLLPDVELLSFLPPPPLVEPDPPETLLVEADSPATDIPLLCPVLYRDTALALPPIEETLPCLRGGISPTTVADAS